MFGSNEAERHRVAVTVTLISGAIFNGHVFLGQAQKLRDLLNNPDTFIDFEMRDNPMTMIAKRAIATISAIDLPRTDHLFRRANGSATFDPYHTLGVDPAANPGEVRAAYLAKARLYHPDKLASKDVPKEVGEYMNAMFIRIQRAYDELETHRTLA
ncbi:MAG: J domain-containing protein [Alphaproteobacteria bacterium]|nr:MAG: J domain-containing protein [Alphaproteobacteria bacterium]